MKSEEIQILIKHLEHRVKTSEEEGLSDLDYFKVSLNKKEAELILDLLKIVQQ